MLMKFSAALLTITLSAGFVHAMTPARSQSLSFAHFPTCSEGLVTAKCVCARQQDRPLSDGE
jgi:hypothetical protein